MNSIKINCPAKINLLLEIINKREDGFHNIKSVMQTISLYDTLEIKISKDTEKILLSGNSQEIPYNEKNLVYKAADLFYRETGLTKEFRLLPDLQEEAQMRQELFSDLMNYSDARWIEKNFTHFVKLSVQILMYALKAGVFWQLPEEKLYKNSSL